MDEIAYQGEKQLDIIDKQGKKQLDAINKQKEQLKGINKQKRANRKDWKRKKIKKYCAVKKTNKITYWVIMIWVLLKKVHIFLRMLLEMKDWLNTIICF